MKISAETINKHLEDNGAVQVTTHLKSWIYTKTHAGMFFERHGLLHVRHGRSYKCLENSNGLLVSIRIGHFKAEDK